MERKQVRATEARGILMAITLGAAGLAATGCQPSGSYLVISEKENVRVDHCMVSGDGWSVSKKTLHGGKQEGVEVITIDNGVMQIENAGDLTNVLEVFEQQDRSVSFRFQAARGRQAFWTQQLTYNARSGASGAPDAP